MIVEKTKRLSYENLSLLLPGFYWGESPRVVVNSLLSLYANKGSKDHNSLAFVLVFVVTQINILAPISKVFTKIQVINRNRI